MALTVCYQRDALRQITSDWTRSARVLSARFASHSRRSAGRNVGAELTEGVFGQAARDQSTARISDEGKAILGTGSSQQLGALPASLTVLVGS
jgi:hypothetical protein